MACLLVFKQQEALPVQFQWHHQHREVIPLVGEVRGGLRPCELHKGMVVLHLHQVDCAESFGLLTSYGTVPTCLSA